VCLYVIIILLHDLTLLRCKTCAIDIGSLKATYLLTYLLINATSVRSAKNRNKYDVIMSCLQWEFPRDSPLWRKSHFFLFMFYCTCDVLRYQY